MNSGIIAYNGKWIECAEGQHVFAMMKNEDLAPFVVVHYGVAEFEDEFMCRPGLSASTRQKETVFNWCTENGLNFDNVFHE